LASLPGLAWTEEIVRRKTRMPAKHDIVAKAGGRWQRAVIFTGTTVLVLCSHNNLLLYWTALRASQRQVSLRALIYQSGKSFGQKLLTNQVLALEMMMYWRFDKVLQCTD
jgi:hypothetical protein